MYGCCCLSIMSLFTAASSIATGCNCGHAHVEVFKATKGAPILVGEDEACLWETLLRVV